MAVANGSAPVGTEQTIGSTSGKTSAGPGPAAERHRTGLMKEVVCGAIAGRRLLSFTYEGFSRVVEPHLCGRNATGHDVLLAWLVRGHSKSDPRPGWRNYLLTEVQSL